MLARTSEAVAGSRSRADANEAVCSVPDFVPHAGGLSIGAKLLSGALSVAAGAALGAASPASDLAPALLLGLAFAGGLLSTWSPCGYSSLATLRPWGVWSPRAVAGWLPTFFAHGLGYLAGGLVLGGVLALGAGLLSVPATASWPLVVLGALALAYGLDQLGLVSLPYPQRKAQVPHDVRLRWPMWRIGLLYGFALGLNFLTYVRTPVLYVVVAAALLSGSPAFALGLVLALNCGRFLPILVNAFPVSDRAVQRWLAEREAASVAAGASALLLAGTALVLSALA
ncbi:MAG: methylamine utilization protein MauF [Geminicoccaceae bacterium]|nr:methylamine utilization protein MauF [Geminicoccaceae bacterium]MCS7266426.1 methylamine utilization protein MauF [Geminicoccaceae bacterium]MCX7630444.1 methylamine utilization protein MauF [Geminicoccaceae bacterium]MDW8124546.1 methylamine utilization protein MauF [Geminicoccaceae bacterium]MDW8341099.1 methylamine utilization protein MauF [Geminicoccaceae bacterium]